jgi:hypothetical protein
MAVSQQQFSFGGKYDGEQQQGKSFGTFERTITATKLLLDPA